MRTSERRTGRSNLTYQHVTAPTQFVEANGIRFAYRRFGQEGGTPLLFMQHFRGGMDHWDPTVTDGFAKNRPVILYDNAGVASSSGETPDTIDAMAEHAASRLLDMSSDATRHTIGKLPSGSGSERMTSRRRAMASRPERLRITARDDEQHVALSLTD
jgi:hypothetical protein